MFLNKLNFIELQELLADGGYSSGEALAYLHEKNINAYIPNFGQYKSEREGFTFNKEENYYQCTGTWLLFSDRLKLEY